MLLADVFPRHDRPRALGAEANRRVTHLIGPRCGCMQLPVVLALLALNPKGPQAKAMVAPPTELPGAREWLPASPAENWSAQATLP